MPAQLELLRYCPHMLCYVKRQAPVEVGWFGIAFLWLLPSSAACMYYTSLADLDLPARLRVL